MAHSLKGTKSMKKTCNPLKAALDSFSPGGERWQASTFLLHRKSGF
jgi:hypothetical protein